jgi:Domain of unknown function (DUF4145)
MNVSIYCPHCHQYTDLRVANHISHDYHEKKITPVIWNEISNNNWWIGICNACQKPVLVGNYNMTIYPAPRPTPTDVNIPENIRIDLDEAKQCFVSLCYRGCAVLSRRVIQIACVEKGATKNKLVDQIGELINNGIITKEIEEWAQVVRWVGNDAAHPNVNEVTKEDAEDCLKLAEQFLHIIFVTPAIAKARKTARGK